MKLIYYNVYFRLMVEFSQLAVVSNVNSKNLYTSLSLSLSSYRPLRWEELSLCCVHDGHVTDGFLYLVQIFFSTSAVPTLIKFVVPRLQMEMRLTATFS